MRAIEGPLAEVRGLRPGATEYEGAAVHLRELWVAVRASLRGVLERVSLADLAAGRFPAPVRRLLADEDAWRSH
jgi:DNA-binding IscR family transcriptional regulator